MKKCGKRCYKTKLDAMLALASCVSKHSKKRLETRYYWCSDCGAFHLTKQNLNVKTYEARM